MYDETVVLSHTSASNPLHPSRPPPCTDFVGYVTASPPQQSSEAWISPPSQQPPGGHSLFGAKSRKLKQWFLCVGAWILPLPQGRIQCGSAELLNKINKTQRGGFKDETQKRIQSDGWSQCTCRTEQRNDALVTFILF